METIDEAALEEEMSEQEEKHEIRQMLEEQYMLPNSGHNVLIIQPGA